jgi:hypothetical protein
MSADSMVERVARAIYVASGGENWDGAGAWVKAAYTMRARAAIEAMRTPTPNMLEAGTLHPNTMAEAWHSMITAALDTRDDGQVAETAGALAPSVQE